MQRLPPELVDPSRRLESTSGGRQGKLTVFFEEIHGNAEV